MKIIVKPGAKRPRQATKGSCAYDLASTKTLQIPAGCHAKVPTGIHMEVPRSEAGTISHRSGMNSKQGIQAYGRIDSDYIGEIFVTLFNSDPSKPCYIEDGDWIAQIAFVTVNHHTFEEVKKLRTTERGEDGHGSTGR